MEIRQMKVSWGNLQDTKKLEKYISEGYRVVSMKKESLRPPVTALRLLNDKEIYVYICLKCEGVTVHEAPYSCVIWMLPCESCGHQHHMLDKYYVGS
jgi:hypothetical protein